MSAIEDGTARPTAFTTDFDHFNSAVPARNVRDTYNKMREACPVAHSPHYGGFDILSRYADVRAALNDSSTYSSADGSFIPPSGLPPIPALDFDEPEHTAWRSVLERPLSPTAVRSFEPVIAEVVDGLIDEFATKGAANLVDDLAAPLPAIIIGRIVGLDQQQAIEVRGIAETLFASIGTDEFERSMAQFAAYTDAVLGARRVEPRDDFMTALAGGVVEGRRLDSQDIAGLLVAYLIGGHHSTTSGLAGLLGHILTAPGLRDAVREDSRILSRAIEESLRLTTPLQLFTRTVTRPVSVDGYELAQGSRVTLNLAAANRDPREFDAPEEFNLNRTRNRHVAFGAGTHVCVGQHLARTELRIAVQRLFERLPDLELAGEIASSGIVGGVLMTTLQLPVSFSPEQR